MTVDMKSKITPHLAERFARSIQLDSRSVRVIDADAPDLGEINLSPFVAGLKASHLSKRFADNKPLGLEDDDRKIFTSLCRLRRELRALGVGKIEAEVPLEIGNGDEGARCDFLSSLKADPKDKVLVELKLTGHELPACPDGASLLQAAGYADLVVRQEMGRIRLVIVCYMSLRVSRMRLFVYKNTLHMREVAGKLLRN